MFEDESGALLTPPVRGTWTGAGCGWLRHPYAPRRKVSMAAFGCYRPGRLPKLFYTPAPDASFTQDEFGPLLTEPHQAIGGRMIVVWDQLPGHGVYRGQRGLAARGDPARVLARA